MSLPTKLIKMNNMHMSINITKHAMHAQLTRDPDVNRGFNKKTKWEHIHFQHRSNLTDDSDSPWLS